LAYYGRNSANFSPVLKNPGPFISFNDRSDGLGGWNGLPRTRVQNTFQYLDALTCASSKRKIRLARITSNLLRPVKLQNQLDIGKASSVEDIRDLRRLIPECLEDIRNETAGEKAKSSAGVVGEVEDRNGEWQCCHGHAGTAAGFSADSGRR
jgi:hypothetical protein